MVTPMKHAVSHFLHQTKSKGLMPMAMVVSATRSVSGTHQCWANQTLYGLFIKTRPQKTKYPQDIRQKPCTLTRDMIPWGPDEKVQPPVAEEYKRGHGAIPDEKRGEKLLLIWRHRGLKRRPWFDIKTLDKLGIGKNTVRNTAVIQPNTPSVLKLLWKVKHLVTVKEVTFPWGEVTEEDVEHSLVKRTGEFLVSKKLKMPEVASTETYSKVVKGDMIRTKAYKAWEQGDMRIEEYPPKHYLSSK
ncbi:PREDICTED: uncharacterized protein LOC106810378 [Priapulus caudatus]|uniref:Large ribosomal subunit protein uL30m n=1 Tax=Priapulus caudatus TaxID=37621 RepID=A0ABM1EAG5_PRICU|nr:PREDICTED: uncharacterized protein LOC106810378 [Priapulus caudatus]